MSNSIFAGLTFCTLISKAKLSSMAFLAMAESFELTPIQIECSEDACVIIIIFICLLDKHSKKRFEKPGMPIIPLPSRLIKATSSI